MSLTPEQIKKLLAQPEKKPRQKKSGIDTSVRDHATWFKLAHKLFDHDNPYERIKCDNPNCQDPRGGSNTIVAEVNGLNMCRYCFLEGYGAENPDQIKLGDDTSG